MRIRRGRRAGQILPGLTSHVLNTMNKAAKQAITPDAIIGITRNVAKHVPGLITKLVSKVKKRGGGIHRVHRRRNKRGRSVYKRRRAKGVYKGRRIQRR
jgi:hypothetical protein